MTLFLLPGLAATVLSFAIALPATAQGILGAVGAGQLPDPVTLDSAGLLAAPSLNWPAPNREG